MNRPMTLAAATAIALAITVPGAVASKDPPKPKQIASALCVAEKQADRAAFEATYGQNAMRDCKRAKAAEAGALAANAAQECRAEQTADPAAFADTYGANGNGKNAFGKCVSSKVAAETGGEGEQFANAAQQCRAERSVDPVGFSATYATNPNGRNAFGKCVSAKSDEQEAPAPTK